jgi:hypothetical protein
MKKMTAEKMKEMTAEKNESSCSQNLPIGPVFSLTRAGICSVVERTKLVKW